MILDLRPGPRPGPPARPLAGSVIITPLRQVAAVPAVELSYHWTTATQLGLARGTPRHVHWPTGRLAGDWPGPPQTQTPEASDVGLALPHWELTD